jgi:hypothetical protein
MIINIWAFVIVLFTAGFLAGVAIYLTFIHKAKIHHFQNRTSFSRAIKPKNPKNKGFKLHIPRGLPLDRIKNFLEGQLSKLQQQRYQTKETEVMAFIGNIKNEVFGDSLSFDKLATKPNSPKCDNPSMLACDSISRIAGSHSRGASFEKMTDLKDFYRLLEKIE